MTLIGRLFVRGVAAAGAIGAAAAIGLAPQPGAATTLTFDQHGGTTSTTSAVRESEPAPSAACVAATSSLFAALKADVSEDASERNLAKTGANTNDPTEDQAEWANFKSLRSAMVKACAPHEAAEKPKPPPTAACTSAKAALKAFFTQLHATEMAEWANHTEFTDADRAEDQASFAQMKTLFQSVASACGFKPFGFDER
jgi:hypothetical protein